MGSRTRWFWAQKILGSENEYFFVVVGSYGFPQCPLPKRNVRLDNGWLCDPIVLFHIQKHMSCLENWTYNLMLNLRKRQTNTREWLTINIIFLQRLPGPRGRFAVTWGNIFFSMLAWENNMLLKTNQERSECSPLMLHAQGPWELLPFDSSHSSLTPATLAQVKSIPKRCGNYFYTRIYLIYSK